MAVKFLFINAINPYAEIEYRYPPLGIGYLINSLRDHLGPAAFEFRVVNRDVEKAVDRFSTGHCRHDHGHAELFHCQKICSNSEAKRFADHHRGNSYFHAALVSEP